MNQALYAHMNNKRKMKKKKKKKSPAGTTVILKQELQEFGSTTRKRQLRWSP
jgi:hypothetical protein